jgi:hypothetical protein
METLPHDQFTRLTITLWEIWTARRKAIHEEIFQSPVSIHGFINRYIEELQNVAKPTTMIVRQAPAPGIQPRWIAPPPNLAKINVDAAVSRNEQRGVAAAICRDHNGQYC